MILHDNVHKDMMVNENQVLVLDHSNKYKHSLKIMLKEIKYKKQTRMHDDTNHRLIKMNTFFLL